jgi:hypothetical protein
VRKEVTARAFGWLDVDIKIDCFKRKMFPVQFSKKKEKRFFLEKSKKFILKEDFGKK